MKCYKTIVQAFNKLNVTARQWHPKSGYPRSADSFNAIVFRGEPVDPPTLLYAALCLDIDNNKALAILEEYATERPEKAQEVKLLRRAIAPTEFTREEQQVVDILRRLPENRRRVYIDMLSTMES